MSTYPRMTRANLRSLVRELTGVLSTDVITDARINEWLNEALYNINAIGDNLGVFWNNGTGGTPTTITDSGTTYRFPGWEWDNTTLFPTDVKTNLYMESDSDTPPWNNGYYDSVLSYKVTSRIFTQIVDDTTRAAEYDAKYSELSNLLFRDKWLSHNGRFIDVNSTTTGVQYISLIMMTLNLLDELVSIDTAYDVSVRVASTINNELNELHDSYKWPFSKTYSNFAPYTDILCYGAAARLAGEQNLVSTHLTGQVGLSDIRIQTLKSNYETRLTALKTKYLIPLYVSNKPTNLSTITAQVRGMINEYSRDLSDELIYTLIDDAYMSLCYERNWLFLDKFIEIPVLTDVNIYPILSDNIGYTTIKRVKNVFKVPEIGYLFNSTKDVDKLDRIPHALDTTNNDSKYRFDVRDNPTLVIIDSVEYEVNTGNIVIAPTPSEDFFIKVRYTTEPLSLLEGGEMLFDSQFNRYLVYATILNVIAFTGAGDKKLVQSYAGKVEEIKSQMYRYYELDASTETFQIGETGLSIPKYIPQFRVN